MTKCPRARSQVCVSLWICGGPSHFCVALRFVFRFRFWFWLCFNFSIFFWGTTPTFRTVRSVLIGLWILAGVEYRMCVMVDILLVFCYANSSRNRSLLKHFDSHFRWAPSAVALPLMRLSNGRLLRTQLACQKCQNSHYISDFSAAFSRFSVVPKISFTCVCHTCHLCFYSSFVSGVPRSRD